jgi:hypothetical protein
MRSHKWKRSQVYQFPGRGAACDIGDYSSRVVATVYRFDKRKSVFTRHVRFIVNAPACVLACVAFYRAARLQRNGMLFHKLIEGDEQLRRAWNFLRTAAESYIQGEGSR